MSHHVTPASPEDDDDNDDDINNDNASYKDVVTLTVPPVKPRSTSLDASAMMASKTNTKVNLNEGQGQGSKSGRSKSMDASMARKGSATAALVAMLQTGFK